MGIGRLKHSHEAKASRTCDEIHIAPRSQTRLALRKLAAKCSEISARSHVGEHSSDLRLAPCSSSISGFRCLVDASAMSWPVRLCVAREGNQGVVARAAVAAPTKEHAEKFTDPSTFFSRRIPSLNSGNRTLVVIIRSSRPTQYAAGQATLVRSSMKAMVRLPKASIRLQ